MIGHRTVAGLTVAESGPAGAPVVLALHGLTSTSAVWEATAAALPGRHVIAPDLPGRAGSVHATAGPGLAGHADAVARLALDLDLTGITVAGHSMGAFLAPLVAARLGDRVRDVLLLDGGVAPERSLLVRRPVVRLLFEAATRRLDRDWAGPEAYAAAADGKGVGNRPDLLPAVHGWAAYVLGGGRRPRLDRRRLVADAVDSLTGPSTLSALAATKHPVHLVAAAHGAHDDAGPFLSDAAIETGRRTLPRLTAERVAANHTTMLFEPRIAQLLI